MSNCVPCKLFTKIHSADLSCANWKPLKFENKVLQIRWCKRLGDLAKNALRPKGRHVALIGHPHPSPHHHPKATIRARSHEGRSGISISALSAGPSAVQSCSQSSHWMLSWEVCCRIELVHRSIAGLYQFKQYRLNNTFPFLKPFSEYCQRKAASCPFSRLTSHLCNSKNVLVFWEIFLSWEILSLDRCLLAGLYCTFLPPKNYPIWASAKLLGVHTNSYSAWSDELSLSHQAHQRAAWSL